MTSEDTVPQVVPETQPEVLASGAATPLDTEEPTQTLNNTSQSSNGPNGSNSIPQNRRQDADGPNSIPLGPEVGLREIFSLMQGQMSILQHQTQSSSQRIPEPEFFKGTSIHEFHTFSRDLDDYLAVKQATYSTEEQRVRYAAGRVRGEPKDVWNQKKKTLDLKTYTLDQFKEFLLDQVEAPRDRGMTVTFELLALQQKPGQSWRSLCIEFKELRACLDTDPESFWWQFLLSKAFPWLKTSMIKDTAMPRSIEGLQELGARLEKINERNRAEKAAQKGSNPSKPTNLNESSKKNSSTAPAQQKNNNNNLQGSSMTSNNKRKDVSNKSSSPSKKPRRLGRGPLSQEEKDKRREEGRCLYCGDSDHLLANCPNTKKFQGSNSQSSNKPEGISKPTASSPQ